MKKENYKTQYDFIRRLIFNHIRKQENPEFLIATDDSNINLIMLERITENKRKFGKALSTLL
jgi:hypothetical protein